MNEIKEVETVDAMHMINQGLVMVNGNWIDPKELY